jgi:hypothetical protein
MVAALPAITNQGHSVIDNFKTIVGHSGRLQETEIPVLEIAYYTTIQADQMGMPADIGIEMCLGGATVDLSHQSQTYKRIKNPVNRSAGHARHLATEIVVQLVGSRVIPPGNQCPHNRQPLRCQTYPPGLAYLFELLLLFLL